MDALAIIWPLVVVVIWASVFGLTLLLVRMTTRDQQATARAEVASEAAATGGGIAPGDSAASRYLKPRQTSAVSTA